MTTHWRGLDGLCAVEMECTAGEGMVEAENLHLKLLSLDFVALRASSGMYFKGVLSKKYTELRTDYGT